MKRSLLTVDVRLRPDLEEALVAIPAKLDTLSRQLERIAAATEDRATIETLTAELRAARERLAAALRGSSTTPSA